MSNKSMPGHGCDRFRGLSPDCTERKRLEALRESVVAPLSTDVLLHFTDHSVAHSDRVASFVDELIAPVFEDGHGMTPDELGILYAACYLHDLGMHCENVGGLRCVTDLLGTGGWQELATDERCRVLRDHHHWISADIVCGVATHTGPCPDLPVRDLFPDDVAALCAAHNLRLEDSEQSAEYTKLTIRGTGPRMALLAALLRLADILDESHRRACRDRARLLALSVEAETHWWRHWYTEDVSVERGKVLLQFKFPSARQAEYERVIPALQVPVVQAEFRRHESILSANGLMRTVETEILAPPLNTKEEMPNTVYLAMAADLQRRIKVVADQERFAALSSFRDARPVAEKEIEEIESRKAELVPEEYLAEIRAIGENLRALGGIRGALTLSERAYTSVRDQLSPLAKLKYATELAGSQVDDDSPLFAMHRLGEVATLAAELDDEDALKLAFYRTRFRALYDLGIHYDDALKDGRQALSLARAREDRTDVASRLIEMCFVCAAPEDALGLLAKGQDEALLSGDNARRETRRLVWRIQAMAGGIETRLSQIDESMTSAGQDVLEDVRDLLLKAELLFMDGRLDEALAVFRESIWPLLTKLPEGDAATIVSCYHSVSLNSRDSAPLITLTESFDERRLAGLCSEDEHNALLGLTAAEEDKHYDAIAHLLVAARHALSQGSWDSFRRACSRLSRECVRVDCLSDAAYYALLARDGKLTQNVSQKLAEEGTVEGLAKVVTVLLRFSRLAVHARVACDMLCELADVLADDQIPGVIDFLVESTSVTPAVPVSNWEVSRAAWKAISALTPRCSASGARSIANSVLQRPDWRRATVERVELINVLRAAAEKLPPTELAQWVESCIPLATTEKHDFDYYESVELLCRIADRGTTAARHAVANALCPGGEFANNGLLLHAAASLGVRPSREDLAEFTGRVVSQLENRIQILELDQEPTKLKTGSLTRKVDGKKIVVYDLPRSAMGGIVRHSSLLSPKNRNAFVDALWEGLLNPHETVPNQIAALRLFPDVAEHVSIKRRSRLVAAVLTLTDDERQTGPGNQDTGRGNSPLDRFTLTMGTPDDVRGQAIQCLAAIEERFPDTLGDRLTAILVKHLAHPNGSVRCLALIALQHSIPRPRALLEQALLATRDEDAVAAAAAFHIFRRIPASKLRSLLASLTYSLACAARSQNKRLRGAAAKLTGRLQRLFPEGYPSLAVVAEAAKSDRCWSVRRGFEEGSAPQAEEQE